MNALPSGKKQRPALHLDLDSQRARSSPLSHMIAARGSVNDFSTTLMNEQSPALTPTPSSSTAEWPVMVAPLKPRKQPEASNEPKKIFVVKVCPLTLEASRLLSRPNRILIPSFLASSVSPIP